MKKKPLQHKITLIYICMYLQMIMCWCNYLGWSLKSRWFSSALFKTVDAGLLYKMYKRGCEESGHHSSCSPSI